MKLSQCHIKGIGINESDTRKQLSNNKNQDDFFESLTNSIEDINKNFPK